MSPSSPPKVGDSSLELLPLNLKLDVIAEGVETAEQHAQLSALGCQYAQGFYFLKGLVLQALSNNLERYPLNIVGFAVFLS